MTVPSVAADAPFRDLVSHLGHVPRILIADDHEPNVKLLEAFLAPHGFAIARAYDGAETLERIADFGPDLILLDAMMPKVDGFEVCRQVKENPQSRYISIIIITALNSSEDRVRGIEAGADEFLSKPVNKQELMARTRMLLKTKGLNEKVLHYKNTLQQLIELTTFHKRYEERDVLLQSFARSAAELTGLDQVTIVFKEGENDFRPAAAYWSGGEQPRDAAQAVGVGVGATGWILKTGEPLVVPGEDRAQQEFHSLTTGFVGVPLKSFDGTVFGTLNAYGDRVELDQEVVGVLSLMAQRISSELQLKDHSKHLEEIVFSRTSELRTALQELEAANVDLTYAQQETIFRLSLAAEFKDEATAAHINRMTNYSALIAQQLGAREQVGKFIRLAAPMHDVGKIGIPDYILLKPGKLTPDEFNEMKRHTIIGGRILSGSSSALLQVSERIAITHHERWDGKGYPYGLQGEDIPIEGRIVALADVFDALTTRRPYKPPMPVDKSLGIIKEGQSTQFDPAVCSAFFGTLEEILKVRDRFAEEDVSSFE